jgi:hypothetical protein
VADDLKNANSKVQESLENAILKYQKSLLTNNKSMIDRSYKEVCKIYNDIVLSDGITVPTNEGEFNPLNGTNITDYANTPYASFNLDEDEQLNGGFEVDLDLANRFSPCGGNSAAQRCHGLPNDPNWKNYNHQTDFPDNADSSESWDRIIERGQRNNKNTRSNIPYYYFGLTPGKTALDKLRREFFV